MFTLYTNLKVGNLQGEKATTELSYDFNSYCRFEGKSLAVSDTKLCQISGSDFDGGNINAFAQTFNNRLGITGKSRLRFLYLALETSGKMTVTIFTDDIASETIVVAPRKTGRTYVRVPVGRDNQGTYWSFKLENVGGSWFSLDTMEALPIVLNKGRF